MKSAVEFVQLLEQWSHPARGAWIEIYGAVLVQFTLRSHPARGAGIEIAIEFVEAMECVGRTPQGVRGLKCRRE